MFKNRKKGFTLIELLVVISIMGVLSTIAVVTYRNGREDARDEARVVTYSQFRAALEDYYDEFEFYPCGDSENPADVVVAGNPTRYYSFDSSGSTGYLNGRVLDSAAGCQYNIDSNTVGTPDTPANEDGLADTNYLNAPTPIDPLNVPPHTFWYITPIEGRGEYLIWTTLENNPEQMANDGGECNNIYEVYSSGWLPDHAGALQRALGMAYPHAGSCNI